MDVMKTACSNLGSTVSMGLQVQAMVTDVMKYVVMDESTIMHVTMATQWQAMVVMPTVLWKQVGVVIMEGIRLLTSVLRSVVKSWQMIKALMNVMMATIMMVMDVLLTVPLSSAGLVEVVRLVLLTHVTLSVKMDGSELLRSVMMVMLWLAMDVILHVLWRMDGDVMENHLYVTRLRSHQL